MSLHGQRPKTAKTSTKHPIACIEKRVIDCEAFAALQGSAVVVLLLLARNLEKDRNGHIFLCQEDAERHGVEKKTLYRALKTLTAKGFIHPTTRGGHGLCTKYALTWLPLSKDTKGLHVDSFRPCAYLEHETELIAWKERRGKVSPSRGQKSPQPTNLDDKNPPSLGDKNPHIELNTNTQPSTGSASPPLRWIPAYVDHIDEHGFAGQQCFQIPMARPFH
jgi:hypothetical protein